MSIISGGGQLPQHYIKCVAVGDGAVGKTWYYFIFIQTIFNLYDFIPFFCFTYILKHASYLYYE